MMKSLKNNQKACLPLTEYSWGEGHSTHQNDSVSSVFKKTDKEKSGQLFIEKNALKKRWSELNSCSSSIFVVAETEFGTGLNFLNTWQLWNGLVENRNKTLHYIAFSKRPTSSQNLLKALSLQGWTDDSLANNLACSYPPPLKGPHRIWFKEHRVALTLVFDDLLHGLNDNSFKTDCWFLTPPPSAAITESWDHKTYSAIADKCLPNSTFSSPCSDQKIRKHLADCGLTPTDVDVNSTGKIFTISGVFRKAPNINSPIQQEQNRHQFERFAQKKPWFNNETKANQLNSPQEHRPMHEIIVIGAGLAGAWTARSLAERGTKVLVVDKAPKAAASASGNPVGVLYVKPGTEYTTATQVALLACQHARQRLTELKATENTENTNSSVQCGVLQLLQSDADNRYADKLLYEGNLSPEIVRLVTASESSAIANTEIPVAALFYPQCGKVYPRKLCEELLCHPNISTRFNCDIQELTRSAAADEWHLRDADKNILSTNTVIIATASDAIKFEQTQHLPLKPIRGQITVSTKPSQQRLTTVLCGDGYAAETEDNNLCFGASFVLAETQTNICPAETDGNFNKLNRLSKKLYQEITNLPSNQFTNRASVRTSTPDYLPIVGPVAIDAMIRQKFGHLQKDSNYRFACKGSYYSNLYVNVGHGSKGLTTAPIAAEIISDYISNAPFSLGIKLTEALHPTRFTVRRLIKNK